MKQLNSISTENLINWFDDIVHFKTDLVARTVLLGLRIDINNRYTHYIDRFSAEDLITITDSVYEKNHSQLLSCYKSEGNTLVQLKKTIRDLQDVGLRGTCQYCGVGKPNSMDHYLPISDYPEFSVLGINLIPCCKECNEKKKSFWKTNTRGIINFYLDVIPNSQFLFGTVHFTQNIPCIKYEIRNDNNIIDLDFFEIIKKHFSRLELIKLYDEESTDELDEIIRLLSIYISNPEPISLKAKLLEDATELQVKFGTNYWRAIMRVSLAKSDEFLNYIINKINEE